MIPRFRLCWLLVFLIFPGMLAAQIPDDLLTRIWDGVQQAQKKYTSGCGTIIETRTSSLMVKPMVLRGKFCAEGTKRFMLEYSEPAPLRIRFNENYLNVTTGGKTEVMEVGTSVRRAQSYFSRENSIAKLEEEFHHHRAGGQPGLRNEARSPIGRFSPQAELRCGEAEQAGLPAPVAGSGRQERREQRVRHRRQLGEPEDSGRNVRGVQTKVIERSEIETMIPHRPPFLWIDRVEELEPGVRCVAVKFVDPADPIFAGHFPAKPILPGVLLIEAVAQTAGVMLGSAAPQGSRRTGAAGGRKPLQVFQARDSGPGAAH